MKQIVVILTVLVLPFWVSSCNNEKANPKTDQEKASLKEVIKTNQSNASIEWLTLNELDKKMAKTPKKVIFLFTKKGCPYCKEMKETTLSDAEIIKLMNDNYYAVMLDGKSKEPMTFKGVTYVNDHPNPEDAPWRHNLFSELVDPFNGGYYWPSTVVFDENYNKIRSFPGLQKPAQFKRLLMNFIRQ